MSDARCQLAIVSHVAEELGLVHLVLVTAEHSVYFSCFVARGAHPALLGLHLVVHEAMQLFLGPTVSFRAGLLHSIVVVVIGPWDVLLRVFGVGKNLSNKSLARVGRLIPLPSARNAISEVRICLGHVVVLYYRRKRHLRPPVMNHIQHANDVD